MPVLASRIARASYGVVVQQIYSPAYHFGEDIIHDPYERKKKWAINQIQWLIKKVRNNQSCKWLLILAGRCRLPGYAAGEGV